MAEPGNRWSPQVALDHGLKRIATAGDTIEQELTAEQRNAQQLSAAIVKLNTGIDNLRKQLQPRLWEAEVDFAAARVSPRLALDLPIALTWFEVFFPGNPSSIAASSVYFYDQDGARLKLQTTMNLPAFGPNILPASGILFRKNVSIFTDPGATFPLYVVCGGIIL